MKQKDLIDRVRTHLTNDKVNGNKSLKLGFETRKAIVEYLDCYLCFISPKNASIVERYIHNNYKTYFGK